MLCLFKRGFKGIEVAAFASARDTCAAWKDEPITAGYVRRLILPG